MGSKDRVFAFRDSVRIWDNGSEEIRIRMGVFNFEEVSLDMSTVSEITANYLRKVIDQLQTEEGYDLDSLDQEILEPYEKEVVETIVNELHETNYLVTPNENSIGRELTLSLLGYLEQDELESEEDSSKKKIIFYSDDTYAVKSARQLANDIKMTMDILQENEMQTIKEADLTSNLDGLSTVQALNKFGQKFKEYDAIVMCVKNLNVVGMRNINRISVEFKIPVIYTFIDGPVIGALATNPYYTGCLECFELRTLARLEDHVSYHNFVKIERKAKQTKSKTNVGQIPLLNMLVNIAVSEAYTFKRIGVSKLTGRLLTIYMPTMEIQVQDLLRVPYCPACGAIAKAALEEKNVSSRALVDEMVKNALTM